MNSFSRSIRSLDREGLSRSLLGVVLSSVLVLVWGAWFFTASIRIYEVSDSGRLQVDQAVYPLRTQVAGKVQRSALVLGGEVAAGDILVELDATALRLERAEEQAALTALQPQLAKLEDEIQAKENALSEAGGGSRAALEQARARLEEATSSALYWEGQAARAESLYAKGVIAEAEMQQRKAEAEQRRAAAASQRAAVDRLGGEERTQLSDRRAELEQLRRTEAELTGAVAVTQARIERLAHEIEEHVVRAPAAGQVADFTELTPGEVVDKHYRLGAVVSEGTLKVVADFAPSDALGRIRPGQPARMRLAGFPWAEFGTIPLTVSGSATEVRDGQIRVELSIPSDFASRAPLQHGLTGTVEIEVDRTTPSVIVLRAAGELLAPSTSSHGHDPAGE